MSNDAEGTARLASSQPNGVGLGRGMLTTSPDRLIRTMDGRITSWSPGMQRRYGFTRQDARGQTPIAQDHLPADAAGNRGNACASE